MVAKRVAGVAGAGAGGFAGGFLNNPGALAAIGIVITIVTSLLIFRKDISNFFSNLGKIELPDLPQLPSFDISFPDITFPSITFPSFEFPSFEFPSFSFPEIPSLPSEQTPEQQLEIFGQLLSEQEESIVETIEGILSGGGGAEEVAEVITEEFPESITSLFGFNPPGIVGFGVIGESLGGTPERFAGISETLAGQLGITPATPFEEAISLFDLFQEGGFAAVFGGGAEESEPTIIVDPSIEGEFFGFGPSFEGGFIFATPGDGA